MFSMLFSCTNFDSKTSPVSQIFPDQVQYFTQTVPDFATNAIAQGNKWITTHSDTAAKYALALVPTYFFSQFISLLQTPETGSFVGIWDCDQSTFVVVCSVQWDRTLGGWCPVWYSAFFLFTFG
jgi:hypothetical protein